MIFLKQSGWQFITCQILFVFLFSLPCMSQRPEKDAGQSHGLPREFMSSLQLSKEQAKTLSFQYQHYQKLIKDSLTSFSEEESNNRALVYSVTKYFRSQHLEEVRSRVDTASFETYQSFLMMNDTQKEAFLLVQKLKLTPEQHKKYDAVTMAAQQVNAQLIMQYYADRAIWERMMEIKEKTHQMMSEFLSEEQMKIYVQGTTEKKRHH